jgi:hypothetical protein
MADKVAEVVPPNETVALVPSGIELAVSITKLTGMLVEATASAPPRVTPEWAGDELACH